jgi:predicted DNA-binding protein
LGLFVFHLADENERLKVSVVLFVFAIWDVAGCFIAVGWDMVHLLLAGISLDTSARVPIQSIRNVTIFSEADPLADKTPILQQPVISIRISDELRQRLDTLKEIMAAKSGEPVSTSEAAKQLLESSKEERLEFVNLLSMPTDSLVKIRAKADAKLPLSQAEWTLVAYYCQQGAELFANTGQTDISDGPLSPHQSAL